MSAATLWAGAGSSISDDPVLFLDRLWDRQRRWALMGLRWVSPSTVGHLSPAAWQALDALALELFRSQSLSEDIQADLVIRAAKAVGPDWPIQSVSFPHDHQRRNFASLDVPALWGVEEVSRLILREYLRGAASAKRMVCLTRAREAGLSLQDSLRAIIGAPYVRTGVAPSARTLDAQWNRFEAAMAAAVGPIVLLPYLVWPAGRPIGPGKPDLRLVGEHG